MEEFTQLTEYLNSDIHSQKTHTKKSKYNIKTNPNEK